MSDGLILHFNRERCEMCESSWVADLGFKIGKLKFGKLKLVDKFVFNHRRGRGTGGRD
jgi:hypothetical protein